MKKLPLGIQTFEKIINNNYLYVDKTRHIYPLINGARGDYFFLARPRRFGKSLLISTLKDIFLGKRELFSQLWLSSSDYAWTRYPVIQLDFSRIVHDTPEAFKQDLVRHLQRIAQEYAYDLTDHTHPETALDELVVYLSKKNPVVILIDEYDKPIVDHLHTIEVAVQIQAILRSLFSTIKSLDEYLRFIFMTGITKFSKTSVFSGLNNLQDITLGPLGADLLGYTTDELNSYLRPYIMQISEDHNSTYTSILDTVQNWYNGYQFCEENIKIYNPYSTLLYLSSGRLLNYWFETGTPSFLVNLIKTKDYAIESIENSELNIQDMGSFELDDIRFIPLLFQTGYLTIKSYNPVTRNYLLDYPNEETKISFLHYFASNLTTVPVSLFNSSILKLTQALKSNDIDLFFQTLEVFFAAIPYTMQLSQEKYYQSIFYVIVNLIGAYIHAEVATSEGRIDATIETRSYVYIFEFKLDQSVSTKATPEKSAAKALSQIKEKRYYQKYLQSNKRIVLIGASFSLGKRNIDKWIVEHM